MSCRQLRKQLSTSLLSPLMQRSRAPESKLTRAKFDELAHSLIERCRVPVEKALADAKISAKNIDEVILVGGSTRIPAVQQLVKALTGKEPNQSVNPDEVVAVGAAIQGAILSGDLKNVVLLDVTPLSLGVETMGDIMTKIIERNTTIPARRSQVLAPLPIISRRWIFTYSRENAKWPETTVPLEDLN